ncbi:hypothetical protein Rhopal_001570-T1 [Rhodotorula paludigena]|uniref:F-box domain-containing protein n=1 Tax=Rhodotorula paludigena TaxID=86838 RepID=A0AAV5GFE6_9BASI|nr:hypothetical protein Rhopal_001570-T1 [Rhodotorula paludigena]
MPVRLKAMLRSSLASTLPEELVDLVCSFVLEFSDKETVETLCSLCLTARSFLPSAHRALFDDPTRSLSRRVGQHGMRFLECLLRRPALGGCIKRLDRLVRIENVADTGGDDAGTRVWYLAVMRHAPNLVSLAIFPDLAFGWPEQLAKLSRLRCLAVQPRRRSNATWVEADVSNFRRFVDLLDLRCIYELELRDYDLVPYSLRPFRVPTPWLRLTSYEIEDFDFFDLDLDSPCHNNPHFLYPLFESASLPALTRVTLEYIWLDLRDFGDLVHKAPNLVHVDLVDSVWHSCEWLVDSACSDEILCNFVAHLLKLRRLRLGYLPLPKRHSSLRQTTYHCHAQGIELLWRSTIAPEVWSALADHALDYNTTPTGEGVDAAVPDEIDQRFPLAILWRDDDDVRDSPACDEAALDPFGHDNVDPGAPTPPAFDNDVERDAWEAWVLALDETQSASLDGVLPYERASSASPDPSADIPPGEGRDYLFAPPASERRFEAEYEALDLVDEENDEPWLEWQERADIAEADREWSEWGGARSTRVECTDEVDCSEGA